MKRVIWLFILVPLVACADEAAIRPSAPPGRDIHLTPDTTVVKGLVPHRTTLDVMLRGHGVAEDAVGDIAAAMRTVFDPRRLRSLQPFLLERTFEGALRAFEYEIDADKMLRVTPAAFGVTLSAEVLPIPKTLEQGVAVGHIDSSTPSLVQSMDAAGERIDLAIALAEVFSGEIDFNSELQPGDQYVLAFERFTREDRPPTYGVITAAEFQNDGRTMRAYRFAVPGGRPSYYDDEGRSLRRFFLRSPLKFEPRITSRFSSSRMHPVLHTARAHRGVDYGAPTGAPVVAVAPGTVVSASFDRTNGRMVRLRHTLGYESLYLHLSAFAPGIRAGVRLEQGEVIGRVGSSGLATGPHLHYGLTKNGVFVNPLREHLNLPPGEPVPASAMEAFLAARDESRVRLGLAAQ